MSKRVSDEQPRISEWQRQALLSRLLPYPEATLYRDESLALLRDLSDARAGLARLSAELEGARVKALEEAKNLCYETANWLEEASQEAVELASFDGAARYSAKARTALDLANQIAALPAPDHAAEEQTDV